MKSPAGAKTPRDYKELLRAGRWFSGLDDGFQDALLGAARLRTLTSGAQLFARGDKACGLYSVVEGRVRISGSDPGTGKEAILIATEPPGWFGEIAVFDGLARTHDAVADTDSILVHVPQTPLRALMDADPRRWRELGVLVSAKLRLALVTIEDIALRPIGARLAQRLVLMAEGHGEWHDRSGKIIALKQEQLALMLSTSRQTVNALLKELESSGAIRLAYGEIEILDLEALRREAKRSGG